MCGICGIVGREDEELLKRMCRLISHRGPDEEGHYVRDGVSLGIRRLKVIDLVSGSQPVSNEDGTVWLVYNGEIYNFPELRRELERRGHSFRSRSDTEVIVHLYEEKGEACVSELRGMFSFALWDARRRMLVLARDRLGEKPLYFTRHDGSLIFASEVKAVIEALGRRPALNPAAVDAYFTFLYNPTPSSIYRGIEKLPPGCLMTYRADEMKVSPYWELSFPGPQVPAGDEETICRRIRDCLREVVGMQMISDVPLGAFLSGGIDSSTVVALMSQCSGQPVKTFSIGFDQVDESFNELSYARRVARRFRTDHTEYILAPEVTELISNLVWYFDEPFGDSSAILTYLISRAAREKVTVALTGIGGDELFGGYPRYVGMLWAPLYDYIPEPVHELLVRPLVASLPPSTSSQNLPGRLQQFIAARDLTPARRYISWVSFFTDEDKARLYAPPLLEQVAGADSGRYHEGAFAVPRSRDVLDRVYYTDLKTYLVDDLLMMADRMSMANSLELRVPFCDYRLAELSAQIPGSLKMKHGRMKYLLKRSIRDLLPPSIVERGKRGFMIPLARWLREEMRDFVCHTLAAERIARQGFFNPAYVSWLVGEHIEGRQNLAGKVWALLVFVLWYQKTLEGRGG